MVAGANQACRLRVFHSLWPPAAAVGVAGITPNPPPPPPPLQADYPVTISGQYYPLTEADNNGTTYPQQTTCGNEMDSEITIHWHGIVQRNSVIMDGVAEVGVT